MKTIITWLPAMAWSVIIVIASLNSSNNLTEIRFDVPGMDKIVHLVMYGVLCFLLFCAVEKSRKQYLKMQTLLLIILGSSAFGILMEVLQKTMTSVRNFDIYDIYANIIGVLLGFGVFILRFKPFK